MSISHYVSQSNQPNSGQTQHVTDKGSLTNLCFCFFFNSERQRCLYLGTMSWRTLILFVWGQGVMNKTDTAFLHLLYNVVTAVLSCVMELTRLHAMSYYWWQIPFIWIFLSHYSIHPQNTMDRENGSVRVCFLPGFVLRINFSFASIGSLVGWNVPAKFTLAF